MVYARRRESWDYIYVFAFTTVTQSSVCHAVYTSNTCKRRRGINRIHVYVWRVKYTSTTRVQRLPEIDINVSSDARNWRRNPSGIFLVVPHTLSCEINPTHIRFLFSRRLIGADFPAGFVADLAARYRYPAARIDIIIVVVHLLRRYRVEGRLAGV